MASTVDTGDIKLRLYETRQLTALDPGHKLLFDDPVAGPGHAGPEAALAAGMANTPQTVAAPSINAEVVLLDQGRVQRYAVAAFSQANQWYLGPYPTAPFFGVAGAPLIPGNTYFDTSTLQMYIYTGPALGWQIQAQLLPANLKTYTWYCLTPQTVFPDRAHNPRDVHGQILQFDAGQADDVTVFLNGAKLVGNVDYFLQPDITVQLGEAACDNSIVEIRVAKRLVTDYAVSAVLIDTSRWVFDGVTNTFPLYDMQGRRVTAATSVNCLVSMNSFLLNPATEFQVLDGSVVFTLGSDPFNPRSGSPEPDDTVWMQVGLPITPTIWDNAIEIGGGGILEISPGEPLLFQGTAPVAVNDDTTPTQLPAGLVPLTQAPTPSSAVHGKFCLLSRTGFTDQLLVCVKGLDESYYWQPLIYLAA
jgi:hypothetical protein